MKLAELCGTSTSYIGEIEIAKKFPSIEMVQKIAAALAVSPYKLFMAEDEKEYPLPLSPETKEALIALLQKNIRDTVVQFS